MQDRARTTGSKLMRHLIVPLTFLTFLNSLDRVNVSFAALQMNAELHLTPERYGFGVGLFFAGYLAFQFPHTFLLQRVGARRWIFATVLLWGGVATCMALIRTATHFYLLRILLGVAESGFAPGIVFLMSQWVPNRFRASAIAGTMLAVPISVVFGGPLSGWLMTHNFHFTLPGWRFMFLVEGLATVLVAILTPLYFVDEPGQARWLAPEEMDWLTRELECDRASRAESSAVSRPRRSLFDGRIWAAAGVYFSLMAAAYGIMFWLPQVVKQMSGRPDFEVTVVSALPWAGLGAGMFFNSRHSDHTQERYWHIGVPAMVAACSFASGVSVGSTWAALLCLVVGSAGLGGAQGAFWALPTTFLERGIAARSITLIMLIGNTAGLLAPPAIGWIRTRTGSFGLSVCALAVLLVAGSMLLMAVRRLDPLRADARAARHQALPGLPG
jgi:ACS family tartrate transporter-like MFS transporter